MNWGEMNPTAMRICLWAGVALVVTLIIAQHLVMGFVPPPSPELSPAAIAQIFITNRMNILAGCTLQIITWSFYGLWATPMVLFIRKAENGWPIFTYASFILLGCCCVFFILVPLTWAVIAFRAPTMDPNLIQVMNDWVWFDWLFTWPPYSVWMFVVAGAILCDRNVPAVFPRWLGYFNIWTGILIVPACLIAFFMSGPFAYDGLVSFWIAAIVFFGWMVVMTVETFKAVTREEIRQLKRVPVASAADARRLVPAVADR
jgi:hypothetical protein